MRILWRRKRLLVLIPAAVVAAVLAAVWFIPSIYVVRAHVRLVLVQPGGEFVPRAPRDFGRYLYSRSDYEWALNALRERFVAAGPRVVADLAVKDRRGRTPNPQTFADADILSLLQAGVGATVRIKADSEVFVLAGYGPTPDEAGRIANALTRRSMATFRAWHAGVMSRARERLERLEREFRSELEDVEAKLAATRARALTVDYDAQAAALVRRHDGLAEGLQRIQIDHGLALALRSILERLQERLPELRKVGTVVARDRAVQETVERILALQREAVRLLVTLGADVPAVRSVQSQLAEARGQLRRLVKKTLAREDLRRHAVLEALVERQLDNRMTLALFDQHRAAYEAALETLRVELAHLPTRELELDVLQRDGRRLVSQQASAYTALATARMLEQIPVANLSVVRPGVVSSKEADHLYFPRTGRLMAVALCLGGLLGLAGALVAEHLDHAVRTPADVRHAIGDVPVLTVPHGPDALPAAGRSLLALLSRQADGTLPQSVCVTSGGLAEGKTSMATALAAALADTGRRTCLVDAHLARPAVAARLGLRTGDALSQCLAGGRPFDEAIVAAGPSGLAVLADESAVDEGREALAAQLAGSGLETLRAAYETVVLDGPPVRCGEEAAVFAEGSDVTVYVIRAGAADHIQSSQVYRRLAETGTAVVVVLNGVSGSPEERSLES